MSARWEIVQTDAEQPFHGRIRYGNGKKLATTETYTKRRAALHALGEIARDLSPTGQLWLVTRLNGGAHSCLRLRHLVWQVIRWAEALRPEWIACEQVAPVLPIWQHMAHMMRGWGYKVWTGVVDAADFGVPLQQIGNAVPPLLAARVLSAVTGRALAVAA